MGFEYGMGTLLSQPLTLCSHILHYYLDRIPYIGLQMFINTTKTHHDHMVIQVYSK
jgi:hypothetical protein